MISIHMCVALACAFLVFQLVGNHFYSWVVKALPWLYLIFCFSLILLKSRGVQGVNLNLFSLVDEFLLNPRLVFFNLLIFVPFGMIICARHFSLTKATAIALCSFFICEVCQYIFHLGIFDISDIVLNLFGYLFGYFVVETLRRNGIRFVKSPEGGYKFQIVK